MKVKLFVKAMYHLLAFPTPVFIPQVRTIWNTHRFFTRHAPTQEHAHTHGLIRALSRYWLVMIVFTLLSMAAILSEPFFVRYLRQAIEQVSGYQLLPIFIAYKVATSAAYVLSDYCSIALGVRTYTLALLQVLSLPSKENTKKSVGSLWTTIEDDC